MADWSDEEAKQRLMSEDYYEDYINYWKTDLADLAEMTEKVVDEILTDVDLEDLSDEHPHVMASRQGSSRELPTRIDWREHGVVTNVKNQGSCGSCWAFAAVGAIESAYSIRNKGKMVEFSEQQILDCVYGGGYWSSRCNGGYPSEAFKFAKKNFIGLKENYPYKGKMALKQKCLQSKEQMFPAGAEKNKNWLQKILDLIFQIEEGEQIDQVDFLKAVQLARTLAREGRLIKVEKHYKVGTNVKSLKQAL